MSFQESRTERDLSDDDSAERVGEPILNFPSSQDREALSSKAAEDSEQGDVH